MILLRKILFPFAIIYWVITYVRNWLYDVGFFKSSTFNLPVIAVGNLSVGGTGKTPHIEMLIRMLNDYKVATLSRGYKRTSEGFVLADNQSDAAILGDEPFQFYSKFPHVSVAVDADRRNGIQELLKRVNPEVILLDDAYQHRKVKAGFYVLLTTYSDLFCDDYILPFGNLREPSRGKKRADVVIVTKCPSGLSETEQSEIKKKLKVEVPVYFSTIEYDQKVYSENGTQSVADLDDIVLVAGIAKPDLFFDFFGKVKIEKIIFPDHHNFTEQDLEKIKSTAQNRKIVTTEKDYMRLKGKLPSHQLFYLPIQSKLIHSSEVFQQTILRYVG
ncbi:tetraacyldisaccharide 4'-kinase [Flavobacterium chuncheonense]|uniref:Tetraacyldisaccharide 4'-kinase n=1 Tax=Flavobacterium chuncheonense TaxID=2026653 RepID=A0ABW5YKN4_9FLAO